MQQINDRFTFDRIFKKLLQEDFAYDQAKDIIINNYVLSALVFQERIENEFYKKIEPGSESRDLWKLKNRIFNENILPKN